MSGAAEGDKMSMEMAWQGRWAAAIVASILALLLGVASQLEPDPRGMGTHEQLGLSSCTFVRLWGIGCPSCGMTTSWAHAMNGDLRAAAGANVAGLLLALLALASIPWLLASAVRGRWCYLRPQAGLLLPLLVMLIAIAVCEWCRRWGPELPLDGLSPFR
jgi:hypothetical protein